MSLFDSEMHLEKSYSTAVPYIVWLHHNYEISQGLILFLLCHSCHTVQSDATRTIHLGCIYLKCICGLDNETRPELCSKT